MAWWKPWETKSSGRPVLGTSDALGAFLQFGQGGGDGSTASSAIRIYEQITAVSIPINMVADAFSDLKPILMRRDGERIEPAVLEAFLDAYLDGVVPDYQMSAFLMAAYFEGLDADGGPQAPMTGCHQPSERFRGTVLPFAWFAQGLRLIDIADPYRPVEVGCYEPDPPDGFARASSNDVTIDDRGLIYLVDRQRGVDIIETTAG